MYVWLHYGMLRNGNQLALLGLRRSAVSAMAETGARWGKVDHESAALAIGVTIPLALVLTVSVLFLGWLNAPRQRHDAAPIMHTRPTDGRQAVS